MPSEEENAEIANPVDDNTLTESDIFEIPKPVDDSEQPANEESQDEKLDEAKQDEILENQQGNDDMEEEKESGTISREQDDKSDEKEENEEVSSNEENKEVDNIDESSKQENDEYVSIVPSESVASTGSGYFNTLAERTVEPVAEESISLFVAEIERPGSQQAVNSRRRNRRRKIESEGTGESFFSVGSVDSSLQTAIEEEEVEEEEIEEEEKDEDSLDRDYYYMIYEQLLQQYQEEKCKNSYLNRKVAAFYKKKKMGNLLQEGKEALDVRKKYDHQLDKLYELNELKMVEEAKWNQELTELKQKCQSMESECDQRFCTLQNIEYELVKELSSETEGMNKEKIAETYLKRQRAQMGNATKMRLDYIKLKNRCVAKQTALDSLDNLGENLHLIDYEQLKLDNRGLQEKLEEKEDDLIRVRLRCQNTAQLLAHIREKSHEEDIDIDSLKDNLDTVLGDYEEIRGDLTRLKLERDHFRTTANTMKRDSGLLARPKLLNDMSTARLEADCLQEKVNYFKSVYWSTTAIINEMRKVMASPKKLNDLKAKMRGEKVNVEKTESTISDEYRAFLENRATTVVDDDSQCS